MRIIAVKTIKEFWEKNNHQDAEQSLRAWYHEAKQAKWRLPSDIKKQYKNASILRNNRVVFNINGNKYRLVVAIQYRFQIIFIRFIGAHADYDKIKVEEI